MIGFKSGRFCCWLFNGFCFWCWWAAVSFSMNCCNCTGLQEDDGMLELFVLLSCSAAAVGKKLNRSAAMCLHELMMVKLKRKEKYFFGQIIHWFFIFLIFFIIIPVKKLLFFELLFFTLFFFLLLFFLTFLSATEKNSSVRCSIDSCRRQSSWLVVVVEQARKEIRFGK